MKQRHLVLSIVFVSWIISYMDRTAMSVAIPYIAGEFHLTPFQMGLVLSAFFLSNAIGQIPGGVLADRFGARKVATASLAWWSLFTAVTGTVTGFAQMLVARFCFGIGEGLFPAASLKVIANWFPKRERASANAIKLAAQPLGGALGVLAVSAMIAYWGWRPVFFALFVPGIVVAYLFWRYVQDEPPQPVDAEGDEPDGHHTGISGSLRVLHQYRIWHYFFIMLTFQLADSAFISWLPTYLVKARGFSALEMGAAASVPRFAAVAGCLIGGWVSDRFFRRRRKIPIIATMLLAACFLLLTCVSNSALVLVVAQGLAGFFLMSFFSAFWAIPINAIPRRLIGATSGVINMGGQTAAFLSPLIIGSLIGAGGRNYDYAFAFMVASLLVSCGLLALLPREEGASEPQEADRS